MKLLIILRIYSAWLLGRANAFRLIALWLSAMYLPIFPITLRRMATQGINMVQVATEILLQATVFRGVVTSLFTAIQEVNQAAQNLRESLLAQGASCGKILGIERALAACYPQLQALNTERFAKGAILFFLLVLTLVIIVYAIGMTRSNLASISWPQPPRRVNIIPLVIKMQKYWYYLAGHKHTLENALGYNKNSQSKIRQTLESVKQELEICEEAIHLAYAYKARRQMDARQFSHYLNNDDNSIYHRVTDFAARIEIIYTAEGEKALRDGEDAVELWKLENDGF